MMMLDLVVLAVSLRTILAVRLRALASIVF